MKTQCDDELCKCALLFKIWGSVFKNKKEINIQIQQGCILFFKSDSKVI